MAPPTFFTKEVQACSPRAASLVFLLVVVARAVPAESQPAFRNRLEALWTQLLSNYSGRFAPSQSAHELVDVFVTYAPMAILDLNAAKQVSVQVPFGKCAYTVS